jgi:hypothetical protein
VREDGVAWIDIVIGLGADRADVALAVLHEVSHAAAGAGHHRRWRQTLRAAAIQMFPAPVARRIPELRGLKFRELEDAVAEGIRVALGCPPAPDYLRWKRACAAGTTQAIAAEAPTPRDGSSAEVNPSLCAKWRAAVRRGKRGAARAHGPPKR